MKITLENWIRNKLQENESMSDFAVATDTIRCWIDEYKVQNKIDELAEKFSHHVNPYVGSGMLSNTYDDDVILWQARKCALITVNEILANTPMYTGNLNPKWSFWNEVKIELTKERDKK